MSKPPLRLNVRSHVILRNLPHIVAAGDAGSLHRAAHHLGIAPSALSRRIADVEAELGAPSFTASLTACAPRLRAVTLSATASACCVTSPRRSGVSR